MTRDEVRFPLLSRRGQPEVRPLWRLAATVLILEGGIVAVTALADSTLRLQGCCNFSMDPTMQSAPAPFSYADALWFVGPEALAIAALVSAHAMLQKLLARPRGRAV